MPTRRRVLKGAGATMATLALPFSTAAAPIAGTQVDFEVSPGACDCHVHIVGDRQRFPMAANRTYTPPTASPDELLALQRFLGFDRVVLVQPSFYGADNAAMLEGLRRLGPQRARGVAVIDETTSPMALDEMEAAGVRGIRVNLETAGETDPAAARKKLLTAVGQIRSRNWHLQLYTRPTVIAALARDLAAAPTMFVLDHFAGAQAAPGVSQNGFDAVLALLTSGKVYVKLSAAYRESHEPAPYRDATPLAQALIAANPERILWGSDWPHTDSAKAPGRTPTDISPFIAVDDGLLLNQLPRWAPDSALRYKILVENPARLYRF